MDFTFEDYKLFCYDFNLKPSHYESLKIFRRYFDGDFDVIFSIA